MRIALVTAILVAGIVAPAVAHETGVIRILSRQVTVGGELMVQGEKLSKNATLRMELRGTLETFQLGEVRTDSTGRFESRTTLPAAVKAGSYTVVVVASDGDVIARADVVVSPAAPMAGMAGMANMAGMAGHAGMTDSSSAAAAHPTAEMMSVAANTSGAGWAAIITIIALSAAAGAALLVRARRSEA